MPLASSVVPPLDGATPFKMLGKVESSGGLSERFLQAEAHQRFDRRVEADRLLEIVGRPRKIPLVKTCLASLVPGHRELALHLDRPREMGFGSASGGHAAPARLRNRAQRCALRPPSGGPVRTRSIVVDPGPPAGSRAPRRCTPHKESTPSSSDSCDGEVRGSKGLGLRPGSAGRMSQERLFAHAFRNPDAGGDRASPTILTTSPREAYLLQSVGASASRS